MAIEIQYKQLLTDIIHTYLPGCRIWLFGSRARRTNKEGADIDLAIDAGRKLTMREIFRIKETIEESSIPVFVDIVDVRNVTEDFLSQIKGDWIVWV